MNLTEKKLPSCNANSRTRNVLFCNYQRNRYCLDIWANAIYRQIMIRKSVRASLRTDPVIFPWHKSKGQRSLLRRRDGIRGFQPSTLSCSQLNSSIETYWNNILQSYSSNPFWAYPRWKTKHCNDEKTRIPQEDPVSVSLLQSIFQHSHSLRQSFSALVKCFLSKFFCLGIAPGGLVTSNTICKFCRACSLQRAQSQRNVKKLLVLSKFRFIPLLRDFLSCVSFFQTEIGTPAPIQDIPNPAWVIYDAISSNKIFHHWSNIFCSIHTTFSDLFPLALWDLERF